jgi:ATP-dependent Lhr-like helicase
MAPTAAGKTEAVIAPLIERYWSKLTEPHLTLLYICPTRALVYDLYARLAPAVSQTPFRLGYKTGDVALATHWPAILFTTPESVDSLLTRQPKRFINLEAIVLDEIHLLDNTPRGDHIRCLLERIERIRQYARPGIAPTHRVALSATVSDPAGVAERYLHYAQQVHQPGGREIVADIRPLYDLSHLVEALRERSAYKSLLFCNTREAVESTALYLRQNLPHHAQIFVHYSNLEAHLRREAEEQFAQASVAICVATSTLELGIDIGSVDEVVLLGAPTDLSSFLQRIGRGGRRANQMQVLCMPQSPAEWARFTALLALAEESQQEKPVAYGFRPSVLVQQIFSLIKQSPTGSIKAGDVQRLAPPELKTEDIRKIFTQLTYEGYLQSGRLGEWKPDKLLQELLDDQEIYSNIGTDVLGIAAVDTHTGRVIAYTDRLYAKGTVLLFGGKPLQVVWVEKFRFGLKRVYGVEATEILRFVKSYAPIPLEITQKVAQSLEIPAGHMAVLPAPQGQWLFHFWGTVWGELLNALLLTHGLASEPVNEFALYVPQHLDQLPPWEETTGRRVVQNMAEPLGNWLQMGRFHRLLPADVATAAVVPLLNLPHFVQAYQTAAFYHQPELHPALQQLISF